MQRYRVERVHGAVVGRRSIAAALVLGLTAACSSMGPRTIRTDQFNYNSAIAGSSNEQLLLNIVRLRYSETPVFLKVSSVINQYRRGAGISASAGYRTGVTGGDTVVGSGELAWADSPTITYAPLSGKEFATNLLTPVPALSLFKLVEAGWPPEHVFRIAVISLNGLENEVTRPIGRRQADPRFRELLELWGRLRADRAVAMSERGEKGDYFLFFPEGDFGEQVRSDRARFRELLGMRAGVEKLHLVTGLLPERPDQLAVLTGSIWDVMVSMAWAFDVPQEHLDQGRTGASFQGERPDPRLIQVKQARERPADAHVAVFSRGYWFYIDDRDRGSKRAFSFLQLLLSLAETTPAFAGPAVTISN